VRAVIDVYDQRPPHLIQELRTAADPIWDTRTPTRYRHLAGRWSPFRRGRISRKWSAAPAWELADRPPHRPRVASRSNVLNVERGVRPWLGSRPTQAPDDHSAADSGRSGLRPQLRASAYPERSGATGIGYISSSRVTSRLRKVGGLSQSLAN
jgi:hypothetical protein